MSDLRQRFRTLPDGIKFPDGTPGASAGCLFRPTWEPEIKPTAKRLIITIAVGRSRDVLRASEPAMRVYADRVGADFLAITNSTQVWPLAEKFRLGYYAGRYDRTLFVDADVFIRRDAPDIFAALTPGAVWAHNDFPGEASLPDWVLSEQRRLGQSQGVTIAPACWNTGVVLFDKEDACIWDAPSKLFPITHCMEQHWVQHQIAQRSNFASLPSEWNYQWWINRDFNHVEEAHFVHLSGLHSNREFLLPLMRALALT